MTNLVALVGLLLVVKFVENTSGELIHVKVGKIARLFGPTSNQLIEQCSVEHNGINYGLYPRSNLTDATFDYRSTYCLFSIQPINFDHAGEWKILSSWVSEPKSVYTTYSVHVEQDNTRLLPGNTIYGENGNYAYVYFKDYPDDITKCYIVRQTYHNEVYILSDNGNGTSAGLKLYQKCGVRIPINDEFRGEWKLVRESGDYKKRTGIITIIPNPKTSPHGESHQVWRHGSSDTKIIINNNGANSYCEVERPDGKVIPLIDPNCEYSVGRVRNKHAGIWKIRYFSKFSLNPLERRIVVHVIDPPAINATVTTTKDDIIHILCQTYVHKIHYCFFTNPKGTMINALPGIGDEKYVYYGTGYYSMYEVNFAQCGITILQPSSDDYGLWKCTIKDENSRGIMRGSVSVAHLNNESLLSIF